MGVVIRVAVVGGGQNCEHEVSLDSAASVAAALDPARYDVVRVTIGADGSWRGPGVACLADAVRLLASCDVVLPIVHGPRGEDGALAALCDFAGVPVAGSGLGAGALAMDKWATKLVAASVGVRVAPAVLVRAGDEAPPAPLPVVVKPVAAGSSRGVTLVSDPGGLEAALELALSFDDRALVEPVIGGREVDLAVLALPGGGRRVGPALEIVGDGVFDYRAKYAGPPPFVLPAPLAAAERAALERDAVTMFDALGCRGVARVDFFLTADGPVLNEVNTMPGMTAHSQVPKMFEADGLPYPGLLDLLVEEALARHPVAVLA
ncbi:MAG: D-alanine--D-alanine ligase [Nocardioidaceae bacterium]